MAFTHPRLIDAFNSVTQGNLAVFPCACPSSIFFFHPLNTGVACQLPAYARPTRAIRFLVSFLEGVAEAALYCAHRTSTSDRARSASKNDTWPLPPYSSEAAHCAIFPSTPYGHGLIGSPTAPVERAQLHRARSGSTGEPSAHDRTPMMMDQQPLIPDPLKKIRG